MWARIENGVVMEITDVDPDGRFHPSLEWVECPAETVCGSTYVCGEFIAPEPVET